MRRLTIALVALFSTLAGAAGIGDFAGYEKIESALGRRLFESGAACEPSSAILDEYRRLHERAAFLTPVEETRYALLKNELSIPPGFLLSGVLGDFQPYQTSFAKLLGSRFQPAMEGFQMESSHAVNALNTLGWDITLANLARLLGGVCAQVQRGRAELSVRLTDPSLSIAVCRSRELSLRWELSALLIRLCQPAIYADPRELRAVAEELYRLAAGPAIPAAEQEAWLDYVSAESEATPVQRVETMFRTLFFNPYFLLRH